MFADILKSEEYKEVKELLQKHGVKGMKRGIRHDTKPSVEGKTTEINHHHHYVFPHHLNPDGTVKPGFKDFYEASVGAKDGKTTGVNHFHHYVVPKHLNADGTVKPGFKDFYEANVSVKDGVK